MIREQYTLGRAPGVRTPRRITRDLFGPGTSRYCLFYWSVTPIFFHPLSLVSVSPTSTIASTVERVGLRGRNSAKREKRRRKIISTRMFRRGGGEFRMKERVAESTGRDEGGGGMAAINETDCRNDRTLGRDTVDKYMPGVLWKLLGAQRGVI